MNFFLLLFLTISLSFTFAKKEKCCQDYCYSKDPQKLDRLKFASKTAYQFVKGHNSSLFDVPNCKPQKIFIFARHGTRLPTAEDISRVPKAIRVQSKWMKNYRKGRKPRNGALCLEDQELLRGWKWNESITEKKAEFLTEQGWKDLFGLAQSYKRLIQQITPLTYNSNLFHFRHTNTQRTKASYEAFFEGLFGMKAVTQPHDSLLIAPYESCRAYQNRAHLNPEKDLFEESDDFQGVLEDISAKLGFKKTLKKKEILTIWNLCRYEQAWKLNEPSAWCAAFTSKQHKILHYREDLKQFYKTGYGYKENGYLMCSLMQNLMKGLSTNDGYRVTAYFGHSTGFYLLMNALGFFKDEVPLTARNFKNQENRKWFISNISPFATNLAVVKYSCAGREKVKFFHKEKLLKLDWCDGDGGCMLDGLLKKYELFVNARCSEVFCQ